jgi:epoxyqueuosine reductase QueG
LIKISRIDQTNQSEYKNCSSGAAMEEFALGEIINKSITAEVQDQQTITGYRQPIIGFVSADHPDFDLLSEYTQLEHLKPDDLLSGARSVVCFFLPFVPEIVHSNARQDEIVSPAWAVAYQETNELIGRITTMLIAELRRYGVRAAGQPATGNFNESDLRSQWSHKSIAVLAGIGSFGLHHLVITDSGCAGRFGSFVIDAALPFDTFTQVERCEYFAYGTCTDCVDICPAKAISKDEPFDRRACWQQCLKNGVDFLDIGPEIKVCGKCAVVGPCALRAAF